MADSLLRWKYTVFYKTFVSSFTLTVFWLISLFRYWKNQHMYTNTYKFNSFSPPHPKWMSHPPCLTLQRLYTPKTSHIALNYYYFFLKKTFSKKSKVFEKLTTTINIFTVTNKKNNLSASVWVHPKIPLTSLNVDNPLIKITNNLQSKCFCVAPFYLTVAL